MELKKLFNHAPIVPLRQLRGGISLVCSIHKLQLLIITLLFSTYTCWAIDNLTIKCKANWDGHLNGDQTSVEEIGKAYNITLEERTFHPNTWETLCLPFDANETDLNNVFGTGCYEIWQYSSHSNNIFVFSKMETASIEAGKAYLIKFSGTNIENPTFNNVILKIKTSDELDALKTTYDDGAHAFHGELFVRHPYESVLTGTYFINGDGTLKKPDSDLLGTQCYLIGPESEKASISFGNPSGDGGGGETTGGGGDETETSDLQQKINARQQLTNLPTIYITLPEKGDTPLNDYLYKTVTNGIEDAPYRPATMQVTATMDPTDPCYIDPTQFEGEMGELQIKVRGNSTAKTDKRPYRLKFTKKHDMLNKGYKEKSWTLLANAFDKSFIRNAVTYHLCEYIGMPFAAGYKFVDLVINNEYRGMYQISDHVQAKPSRININEDNGWYIEFQGRPDMLDVPNLSDSKYGGLMINVKNPDTDDMTAEAKETLLTEMADWFNNKWKSGFTGAPLEPDHGWRAYNDEETLMKFLIATEITGDYDGLMTIKAYRDIDTKLFWGPIWDKDLAYGNYGDFEKELVANTDNSSFVKYDFQDYILKDPAFTKKMADTMSDLVNNKSLKNKLIEDVDRIADLVRESRNLDYEKWEDTPKSIEAQHSHGEDYQWYVDELKRWLGSHIDFIENEFNKISDENNTEPKAFEYNTNNYKYGNGIYNYLNKTVNAKIIGRTFNKGEYNALSVPFRITSEQLTDIFGENYDLKEPIDISEDGKTLYFDTPEGNYVKAAYPYLIKPTKEVVAEPEVKNVMLYNATQEANGIKVTMGNYTFTGNLFKDGTIDKDGTVKLINGDAKGLTAQTTDLQGSNAYIKISNGAADPIIKFGKPQPVERKQLTNLPTVYIDTKDPIANTQDYVAASIEVIDANGGLEPFKEETGLEIRGRGTVSWNNTDKKSYRLKFAKDEKDAAGNVTKSYKHDLINGGYKKRNWTLIANAGDKSLMRNALAKEIGDALGMEFTPGYKFVDLFINNEYKGTYQFSDFIEADAARVNVDEDNGWLIQMTNSAGTEAGDVIIDGTDYTYPYITVKNPEPAKGADNSTVTGPVKEFFDKLWNDNGYKSHIDINTFANWYIASEILGGYNSLSDIYAYKEATDKKLKFGPLWNNEASFDNYGAQDMTSAGLMSDIETKGSYKGMVAFSDELPSAWKTKIQKLWGDPWFAQTVKTRWNEIYSGIQQTILNKAGEISQILKESQAHNFSADSENYAGAGWSLSGAGITEITKDDTFADYNAAVEQVKKYICERLPYLNTKINELADKAGAMTLTFNATAPEEEIKSLLASQTGVTTDVQITGRTLKSTQWNPFALPFDLTKEQITEALGEGYSLQESSETNGLSMMFTEKQDGLAAGVPYLIKPSADVADPTFKNVTIKELKSEKVGNDAFKFVAAIAGHQWKTDKSEVFYLQGKLYYPNAGTVALQGMRAYFELPKNETAAKFSIMIDDGTTTSIVTIEADNGTNHSSKIYNLNGQLFNSDIEKLPKGIYIINGKKTVIK